MRHLISDTTTESIELVVEEDRFALVHKLKSTAGDFTKAVVMNKREVLKLHQTISEEILNKGGR